MFNSIGHLTKAHVRAVDGDIGPIKFVLFDDQNWVARYLVVDADAWLPERDVLVSPYSIKQPMGPGRTIDVALTRRLVRASPAFDSDQPISRGQELAFERHYHYPPYWHGGGLWGLGTKPYPSVAPQPSTDPGALPQHPAGMQLHSTEPIHGFEVVGLAHDVGTVEDLVFDDESWQIHYLVIDTTSWWPGGRKVLIARTWVDRIDWKGRRIQVALTRQQLQASPSYQDVASIHREYEVRLHAIYGRPGYWAFGGGGSVPLATASR